MATTSLRIRARLSRLWRDTGYLLSGMPLWAVPLVVLTVPWTIQIRDVFGNPSTLLGITAALFVPMLFVFCFLPWLTTWQRRRLRALRGVTILDADAPRFGFRWSKARAALQSETMWRQGLYHGIVGPAVGFGVFLVAAIGVAGTFAFFFWSWVQLFKPYRDHTLSPAAGLVVSACGLAGVVAVPWLVSLLTRADEETARRLLGPSPTVALTRRVEVLAASRAAAVEAADAERRRIERDLHDGAQQQLMSLSVNLGLARKTLRNVPDDAMRVIAEAHEQAKEAMAQLRDLVRGLHPGGARRPRTGRRAVGDRRPLGGPGAADGQRSGGAERLGGDGRVLRGVGALANVVKHSQASRATVDVLADAELGWLQVRVSDDGIGGADAARGSGLEGLRQRVATVDGTLRIVSPVGGPTAVTATLPCGG